jgi:hypothetical protein
MFHVLEFVSSLPEIGVVKLRPWTVKADSNRIEAFI